MHIYLDICYNKSCPEYNSAKPKNTLKYGGYPVIPKINNYFVILKRTPRILLNF